MSQPRISSESVLAKTGKDWQEWFELLDRRGASTLSHPEIVALLADFPQVNDWWKQSITVAYEQARGLRELHEVTGGYQVSRSRTFPLSVEQIFDWIQDETRRGLWLDEPLQISSATPGKSVRGALSDGTRLDIELAVKGPARSSVTIRHSRIPNADRAAEMKAFWQAALVRLAEQIEAQPGQ